MTFCVSRCPRSARMLMTALFGLTVLGTGLPLFGADGTKEPVHVIGTEHVDFAPGGVIHLNTTSGNLIVEAWDQPGVEITTTKSTRRAYQSNQQGQATQCLEGVRVVTERHSDTELTVSTMVPKRGFLSRMFGKCGVLVEHQIRAPRDSRLAIQHDAGYVLVSRMTGEIEASSHSGDIMLMLPDPGPYSIDAKSKIGSVSSDFAGTTRRMNVLSAQFTSASPAQSRRIYLRMYLGGITIKELPPTPEAPAAAGGQ
jgi:hypothetical protein